MERETKKIKRQEEKEEEPLLIVLGINKNTKEMAALAQQILLIWPLLYSVATAFGKFNLIGHMIKLKNNLRIYRGKKES